MAKLELETFVAFPDKADKFELFLNGSDSLVECSDAGILERQKSLTKQLLTMVRYSIFKIEIQFALILESLVIQ